MRDNFKNIEYFNLLIEKIENSIDRQLKKIDNCLIKKDRIAPVKMQISLSYIRIFRAMYSRGDDMDSTEVANLYEKMIKFWCESRVNSRLQMITFTKKRNIIDLDQYTFSGYLDLLDLLSIGFLIEASTSHFNMIANIITKDKVKDYLVNFLLKSKLDGITSISEESYSDQNYMHVNQRLGSLKDIIFNNNIEVAQRDLELFLEKKWYNSLKGTGYYDQHNNPNNTYSGYWCFVAAAIAKIKGLDDSSFRDNKYYPKDLV
ncbi:PoNe immunity protein domain-containing protein [Winogradskyella sp.]|uniref:PoNe immunity protein domain-containing protein n=1 Tax=Winogradskyella sp. TaxID=1883156 RepID=UPI003AB74BF4